MQKTEFDGHFNVVRDIVLSYPGITEIENLKQTSYHDAYGVVIMLRPREDGLVIAFGKGAALAKDYPMLQGSGKTVRHLYLKKGDVTDEPLLRRMIEESMMLNMEAYEMKRLRKGL